MSRKAIPLGCTTLELWTMDRQGPLEFALGPCQMIPGFEKTVLSMERRDTATVAIPAEYAYGPQDAGSMMLAERPSCLRTWISS